MNIYFANTPTHLQPYLWAIRHTLEFRVWHQLEHLEWSWEVEDLKKTLPDREMNTSDQTWVLRSAS